MHGDAGGGLGYIALADSRRNVFAIQQRPISAEGRLQLDTRGLGELKQSWFIIKGSVVLDGLQGEGPVHCPALQVDVIELAREPRGNRALARARRAIYGDDQFSGRMVVRGVGAHRERKIVHARKNSAAHLLRRPTQAAQLADAERIVPLGEAQARFIANQVTVIVLGNGKLQSSK